jgi:outer membrane protein assembly factor BamB
MRRTSPHVRRLNTLSSLVVLVSLLVTRAIHADDWPQYRGTHADGVWKETDIVQKFPDSGLKTLWRAPLKGGYTGPSVANGRVLITDFAYTQRPRGVERALAFDEKSGRLLWTQEWDVDYRGLGFDGGPRATPTVDGDRVYVLGASGLLLYVKAWSFYFGFSSPPTVDGNRLICVVGGADAKIVAFTK